MKGVESSVKVERNPDQTRQKILDAAFAEIYKNGFQGMRLDVVLAQTGLTKGALYHHFPNKQALGYAVVDEIILGFMKSIWIDPLEKAVDPFASLLDIVENLPDEKPPEMIQYGCPLNNLAQEMSPLDEGFRQRLDHVFHQWHEITVKTLKDSQRNGIIKPDIDCVEAATFVMAAMEGGIGLAKNTQSGETLRICLRGLGQYLLSLKKTN